MIILTSHNALTQSGCCPTTPGSQQSHREGAGPGPGEDVVDGDGGDDEDDQDHDDDNMEMMETFPGWGLAPGPPPSCLQPGTSQPTSPTESWGGIKIQDCNDDGDEGIV